MRARVCSLYSMLDGDRLNKVDLRHLFESHMWNIQQQHHSINDDIFRRSESKIMFNSQMNKCMLAHLPDRS